jgi:hypothetical protein
VPGVAAAEGYEGLIRATKGADDDGD